MKLQLLLLFSLFLTAISKLIACLLSCLQTKDVFFVYTRMSNAFKPEVVSVNETRIVAAPANAISVIQSLVKTFIKQPGLFWNLISFKQNTTLKTKSLAAIDGWRLQQYVFKKFFRINSITPVQLVSMGSDIGENKETFYQEKILVIKM